MILNETEKGTYVLARSKNQKIRFFFLAVFSLYHYLIYFFYDSELNPQ
jgi:hypothetical protein